jgi:hypothetical protein
LRAEVFKVPNHTNWETAQRDLRIARRPEQHFRPDLQLGPKVNF